LVADVAGVAAGTRFPCALSLSGGRSCKTRAISAAKRESVLDVRDSATLLPVIARLDRATSIPEAGVIEPRGRGVLDSRMRGHVSWEWRDAYNRVASPQRFGMTV
jgi:hypothetical protein